ncbi:hypothetical protein Bbelb_105090 [Branchiostoma belcheri]|nr:hypothetical protein Bbelb_105090 [Branchiostoma belcheri]
MYGLCSPTVPNLVPLAADLWILAEIRGHAVPALCRRIDRSVMKWHNAWTLPHPAFTRPATSIDREVSRGLRCPGLFTARPPPLFTPCYSPNPAFYPPHNTLRSRWDLGRKTVRHTNQPPSPAGVLRFDMSCGVPLVGRPCVAPNDHYKALQLGPFAEAVPSPQGGARSIRSTKHGLASCTGASGGLCLFKKRGRAPRIEGIAGAECKQTFQAANTMSSPSEKN